MGEQNLLREVKEGLHYIWHTPVILSSIGAAYTLSVFVGTYQRFLPVFAKEVLRVGPGGLGVLMAAGGHCLSTFSGHGRRGVEEGNFALGHGDAHPPISHPFLLVA